MPLAGAGVPVPGLRVAGAVPLPWWPQGLLSWKVPCPGHRRWSRRAAVARNQEEDFGNAVGKHFEKGQLDSEQTDRERAVMAQEHPWWHWKTLGKNPAEGSGQLWGMAHLPWSLYNWALATAEMIDKPLDLCSTGCKDYQDFVQLIKNLKAGGNVDMRKAIPALRFW